MRIAVMGAGAFGTALAVHLRRGSHDVRVWTRDARKAAEIEQGTNASSLGGLSFEPGVQATTELETALEDSGLIVLAVPSHAMRAAVESAVAIRSGARFVCVAKGIDPETLSTHSDLAAAAAPSSPFCALTGPSFAREVLSGQPTALVAASRDTSFAREVQNVFSGPRLRVYETDDIRGAELAGSLKNVIAIAAGMVEGLNFGENTRAALITRGLAEIGRLVAASGGRSETVAGLAGLGDLVLTCSSKQSRNHEFGRQVALGRTSAESLAELGTVEGLRTAAAACLLGERLGVETPIAKEVRGVLHEGVSPLAAVESLMLRRLKREVH